MAQSNIDIKIIAEFLGKNAFKQADTAATKLNKTVKTLGSSFGLAFGGAALGYAVKSTIKDFADAQRETVNLTNTVKNLGLAFDAPQVTAYVDQIGKLYGVTGEQAVPAMQALLSVTGSVSKSTQIMNTALDLAASRSANVADVAQDLANAYVGNTKGLNQYRLGLTKAELSAKTFEEIMAVIAKQTLGAADEAAQSLTGQLAILSETANQAKERIGGGLVQALGGFSGPNGAGGAAQTIENLSIKLTNAITGFGYLVQEVKIAQPILVGAGIAIGLAWAPWFTALSVAALAIGAIGNKLKNSAPTPMNTGPLFFPGSGDGGYKEREAARKKAENEAIARNKQLAKLIKDQAKSAMDALKAKRLQNAIDKANLALNKSSDVFDMDKIQIAAALTNQAQQLGKATDAAQILQIANDTARLNVKRSILALEDAIASKDEESIIKATAKLNEDLKILGALTGQKTQMAAIESILKGLTPKELIDQKNLDEALRKIRLMLEELAKIKTPTLGGDGAKGGTPSDGAKGGTPSDGGTPSTTTPPNALMPFIQTPNGIRPTTPPRSTEEINKAVEALGGTVTVIGENGREFSKLVDGVAPTFQAIEDASAFNALVNSFAKGAIGSFNAGSFRAAEGGSIFSSGAVGSRDRDFNITVNTGIGDPNAIAESIAQVLREAQSRGTLLAIE